MGVKKSKNSGGYTYAIRCFLDGKRKFTHLLTRKQARIFRDNARILQDYLTTEYKLK